MYFNVYVFSWCTSKEETAWRTRLKREDKGSECVVESMGNAHDGQDNIVGTCDCLILSHVCFGMVTVRQLLLVSSVLYIWCTTKVCSLCKVLARNILGRALGFIYIGEYSEFGANHLFCF